MSIRIMALLVSLLAVALLVSPVAAVEQPPVIPPTAGVPLTATLTATLLGAEGSSGTAVLTLNPGLGTICYELTVSGLTSPVTAAHIHVLGDPAPLVGFPNATELETAGTVSGCVEDVSRETILAIITNPEGFVVNVHALVGENALAVVLQGTLTRVS